MLVVFIRTIAWPTLQHMTSLFALERDIAIIVLNYYSLATFMLLSFITSLVLKGGNYPHSYGFFDIQTENSDSR